MTNHPLTDEMCDALKETWGGIGFSHHDMRAAYDKGADWQLEQVIQFLEDDFHGVFWRDNFMTKFKKAMRPQEDNQ